MARKSDPFARIPKTLLNDEQLSWKAKGVLSYLIGKPPGWKVRVTDLQKRGRDGRDAVRSALMELRVHGYCELVRIKAKDGTFGESVWKVSDSPIFTPCAGNPSAVNPRAEKPSCSKNQFRKNDLKKNDEGTFASTERNRKAFVPKTPYPLTESEMYDRLEFLEIEYSQDYDGSFFDTMQKAKWTIRGKPIWDWIATYQARLEKTIGFKD